MINYDEFNEVVNADIDAEDKIFTVTAGNIIRAFSTNYAEKLGMKRMLEFEKSVDAILLSGCTHDEKLNDLCILIATQINCF